MALEVGRLWQVSAVISLPLFSGRGERGGGAETLSTPPPPNPVSPRSQGQLRPALLQGPLCSPGGPGPPASRPPLTDSYLAAAGQAAAASGR